MKKLQNMQSKTAKYLSVFIKHKELSVLYACKLKQNYRFSIGTGEKPKTIIFQFFACPFFGKMHQTTRHALIQPQKICLRGKLPVAGFKNCNIFLIKI